MLRSGVAAATAEELAQETMLTVWRKADVVRTSESPAPLPGSSRLRATCASTPIGANSAAARSWLATSTSNSRSTNRQQPDAAIVANEVEKRVRAALTELSAEQTRVVELSFFEEKAHAEIAQILGIPLGTVKSRLRLAMKRLRDLLGEFS